MRRAWCARCCASRTGSWTFFPETLDVGGELKPGTRRRGLHEVRVYEWQGHAAARFDVVVPVDVDASRPRRIERPWLAYGIADVRGLVGSPRLRIAGANTPLEQGLGSRDGSGVHARLAAPRAGERLVLRHAHGLRARRHRIPGAGAAGQAQPFRAGLGVAAPALRRQLPAAHPHGRWQGLPRRVGGVLAGDQRAGAVHGRQHHAPRRR